MYILAPVGSFCRDANMSASEFCSAGQYCSAAGLSTPSGICTPGFYSSINASACSPCRRGLYAPSANASLCLLCSVGHYANAQNATACQVCPPGQSCLLGAFQPAPSSVSQLVTLPQRVTSDPFAIEVANDAARRTSFHANAYGYGSAVVLILLITAIAAQRVDSVGRLVNCAPGSPRGWVSFDVIFPFRHAIPVGGIMQHRQTSFGGFMSLVCASVIVVLAVTLAVENISPAYVASISTETPPWNPHGTFRLTAVVHGSGFDTKCSAQDHAIAIVHSPSDWLSVDSPNSTWTSAADGSCTIVWQCNQCMMVSPSTVPLVLSAPFRAWATYIEYTLDTPALTMSALVTPNASADSTSNQQPDQGTDAMPFSLQGVVVPGNMQSSLTAFRGAAESIVSVVLTNFKVIQVCSIGNRRQRS